jgi:EF hand domain-containing protein
MSSIKRAVIVVSAALMASACAAPQSAPPAPPPEIQGENYAKALLKLMDTDASGKVSRAEFMSFMSKEFDLLDLNKDGELDVKELTEMHFSSKRTGGAGSK